MDTEKAGKAVDASLAFGGLLLVSKDFSDGVLSAVVVVSVR